MGEPSSLAVTLPVTVLSWASRVRFTPAINPRTDNKCKILFIRYFLMVRLVLEWERDKIMEGGLNPAMITAEIILCLGFTAGYYSPGGEMHRKNCLPPN
jgi:hypothetical protein